MGKLYYHCETGEMTVGELLNHTNKQDEMTALDKKGNRRRYRVNEFEIQTLADIARDNDCPVEMLIDAIKNNVVGEQISIQIHFLKTGELPK